MNSKTYTYCIKYDLLWKLYIYNCSIHNKSAVLTSTCTVTFSGNIIWQKHCWQDMILVPILARHWIKTPAGTQLRNNVSSTSNSLTLILLNNLISHTHFRLSANQITLYNVFIQIHKLNENSVDPDQMASEAIWSGSTLFAKVGDVVNSRIRVNKPWFDVVWRLGTR